MGSILELASLIWRGREMAKFKTVKCKWRSEWLKPNS